MVVVVIVCFFSFAYIDRYYNKIYIVSKGCEVKKLSERQWCWFACDGTIGDFSGYLFAVRFKNELDAQTFVKQFNQAAK